MERSEKIAQLEAVEQRIHAYSKLGGKDDYALKLWRYEAERLKAALLDIRIHERVARLPDDPDKYLAEIQTHNARHYGQAATMIEALKLATQHWEGCENATNAN